MMSTVLFEDGVFGMLVTAFAPRANAVVFFYQE